MRETRRVSLAVDGSTQAARWCAGCHDPVPFFSGEFDDPNYDDVNNPTSQAGITCTTCHAITNVNDTRGNAAYTIEEPQHYPFAFSDDPFLQWINNSLVKAKPEMHKKTFFKPILQGRQVLLDLPQGRPAGRRHPLQGFRPRPEPLRHLPLVRRLRPRGSQLLLPRGRQVELQRLPHGAEALERLRRQGLRRQGRARDPRSPLLGANTGLAALLGNKELVERHARFLSDKKVRIDIFGLRDGGVIEGELLGPIRPEVPTLKPGGKYLVEVVVRTLAIGHPFSQGTVDSNEIWVELIARSGGRVIGRSGGIDA